MKLKTFSILVSVLISVNLSAQTYTWPQTYYPDNWTLPSLPYYLGRATLQSGAAVCGTWSRIQPDSVSPWKPLDTLGTLFGKGQRAQVVESQWVYSVYATSWKPYPFPEDVGPCNAGDASATYFRHRIDRKTGIRERKDSFIRYVYTPIPKTEYEQIFDSLMSITPIPFTLRTGLTYPLLSGSGGSDTAFTIRHWYIDSIAFIKYTKPKKRSSNTKHKIPK